MRIACSCVRLVKVCKLGSGWVVGAGQACCMEMDCMSKVMGRKTQIRTQIKLIRELAEEVLQKVVGQASTPGT